MELKNIFALTRVQKYNETFSVSWLLLSELFPAHIRGRAIAMATVFNWGANLIVALTFLNIMSKLKINYWKLSLLNKRQKVKSGGKKSSGKNLNVEKMTFKHIKHRRKPIGGSERCGVAWIGNFAYNLFKLLRLRIHFLRKESPSSEALFLFPRILSTSQW